MKKLVLLSIILILFTTCKKTMYKSGVSGRVLDQYTNNPIENTTVFLVGSNAGTSGSPSFSEIQKIKTASDGKFAFTFNRSEYQHYYLYAKPPDATRYFSNGNHYDYMELSFSKKFAKEYITKDVELLHCGYLKINFNHTSVDTILFVGVGYDKGTLYTDYSSAFQGYTPAYVDNTTYIFVMQGATNNKVGFNITKKNLDGTGTTYTQVYTFYTTPHETIYYQLNY